MKNFKPNFKTRRVLLCPNKRTNTKTTKFSLLPCPTRPGNLFLSRAIETYPEKTRRRADYSDEKDLGRFESLFPVTSVTPPNLFGKGEEGVGQGSLGSYRNPTTRSLSSRPELSEGPSTGSPPI